MTSLGAHLLAALMEAETRVSGYFGQKDDDLEATRIDAEIDLEASAKRFLDLALGGPVVALKKTGDEHPRAYVRRDTIMASILFESGGFLTYWGDTLPAGGHSIEGPLDITHLIWTGPTSIVGRAESYRSWRGPVLSDLIGRGAPRR